MSPSNSENMAFALAVVGAGPAGLVTGLAAAKLGVRTVVIGPPASPSDGRTAALLEGSIRLLRRLDCWDRLGADVERLAGMRLVDATNALFRAPEVVFDAGEIGLDAFGYNVPNAALTAALEDAARPHLTRLTASATSLDIGDHHVDIHLDDGKTISARVVAACDGRQSLCRTAANIPVATWRYEQTAIVTTFQHTRPHNRISTEFHCTAGPLTVVPGPGLTSSLVWVEKPETAARLASLDDQSFADALSDRLGGLLGDLSHVAPRRSFPLSGQTASPLAKNRIALVGEAGHVLPPIGAQGLNLSFRDAATLAEAVANALKADLDPGSDTIMTAYDAARRGDVKTRAFGVDILNRSLMTSLPGASVVRGLGLFALANVRRLRIEAMREGMLPSRHLPALMQALEPQSGPAKAG